MTGPVNSLIVGVAQMLNTAGIGVWDPSSAYTADQVGITIRGVPPSPDHLISLTPYIVSDDPLLNDTVLGVQFRHRGAPNDPQGIQDRDDAVFDLFQGLQRATIGGLFVVVAWRQGGGVLGQDQNLRWERASNFYFRTTYPTTNRTE